MRKVLEDEVRTFLIHKDLWREAEADELRANQNKNKHLFYSAQIHKLKCFGIKIEGGIAGNIARALTPSRAVTATFWVFCGIESLLRRGLEFQLALRLVDWVSMMAAQNSVKDELFKQRIEQIFLGLGFPNLREPLVYVFFENILPGTREILTIIKGSSQIRDILFIASDYTPRKEDRSEREAMIETYDTSVCREPGTWQRQWLQDATRELYQKFGIHQEVAAELIKLVCMAARKTNNGLTKCEIHKHYTQDILREIGLSINEPVAENFFGKLMEDILQEISRLQNSAKLVAPAMSHPLKIYR